VKSGSLVYTGGAKQHKRSEMTSFLFLELSKIPLPLINTSIGGVFFGAAAFPFLNGFFLKRSSSISVSWLLRPSIKN
jgi:hypothetical protein